MTEMTQMSTLDTATCGPCQSGDGLLTPDQMNALQQHIHTDWQIAPDQQSLTRHFTFKGFAKAVYLANLCAWLADREGHHPDVRFGWGYTTVILTSHEANGLTENDFIWARKFDKALEL
jgi:4a-hydroxytetrahydrobiopterin dehydratase